MLCTWQTLIERQPWAAAGFESSSTVCWRLHLAAAARAVASDVSSSSQRVFLS
jgi:hypothetical protein